MSGCHVLRAWIAAAVLVAVTGGMPISAAEDPVIAEAPAIVVGPVPAPERARLNLADFYEQFASADGIPIVASGRVRPEAVAEAAWIIGRMLARRPDVARPLAASPVRVAVMAHDEFTTDIPEHADLRPAEHWNRRARGLGATDARPAVSCGEENLLCFPGDPYVGENILVHEFAHTVHEIGLRAVDPTFQRRLDAAFDLAKDRDCWRGTYALTNASEYWAEGVQSWLGCNRTGGGIHGELNSAAAVSEHDPPLAALLAEVFGADPWVYRVPADRLAGDRRHLAGFDPSSAPRFSWSRAVAIQPPGADLDLTFVITSDPHYRLDPERVEQNRLTIEELNRVTERTWPEKLGGGPIAAPRGVLAPGDLVDDGDKKDQTPGQWAHYVSHFGLDGTDGLLRYPVFDCWGNHDGPPVGKEKHGFSTQAKLIERNRARLAKGMISRLSENGLHYSWDWDGVHFQMLGIYPADTQHEKVRYNRVWHDPQGALAFCVEDLREQVGDSGRPVVIVAHSGFDTDWWHPEDWAAFYQAVEPYNVICYMFGHTGTGVWGWSPSPEAPKVQCINTGQTTKGFFVVRITADRLRAVYRCKDGRATTDGGWTWKFPLDTPIDRVAPEGLAGKAAAGVSP